MQAAGVVLQERYEIVRPLGQGGMGGVYLARHLALDVDVAVKEMTLDPRDPEFSEAAVRQFRNEAQILHVLRHPNLPRVHDFFEADGHHFLVMDYIVGRSLEQVMATQAVSETQVLGWARELCSVLAYLHHHDPPIIFRDLKPSNIMLAHDSHVKLIDFGIAKNHNAATGGGTQTSVRGAGTPGFAAPEQYGSGTDVRTDIYALGATLYTLLTRQIPPESVDIAAGGAELTPIRSLNAGITAQTAQVVEWMLNVNRTQRPARIEDVATALGFYDGPAARKAPEPVAPPRQDAPVALDTAARQARIDADRLEDEDVPTAGRGWGGLVAAVLLLLVLSMAWFRWHPASGPLAPTVALRLESNPPGARIYLSGTYRGTTPATVEGLPVTDQPMALRLEKSGYFTDDQPITVKAGTQRFDLVAQKLRIKAPPGTAVYLNGTLATQVDAEGIAFTQPAPGAYQMHLHSPGYQEFYQTIQFPDTMEVDAVMKPSPGALTVEAPPNARVWVNGQLYPLPVVLTNLATRRYAVKVKAAGYHDLEVPADVKPGPPVVIDANRLLQRLSATAAPPPPAAPPQVVVLASSTAPQPTATETSQGPASATVALTTEPSSPPSESALTPPPDAAHLVVPGQSYGPVHLGMPADEVADKAGLSRMRSGQHGAQYAGNGFHMRSFNGRVQEFGSSNPSFRTTDGLGVGVSRANVLARLGSGWETWGGRERTNAIKYQHLGIGFVFDDTDHVASMGVMHDH